jgi:pSer/pThr/pTyr-binding forkhead associated (FHA) protein
MARLLIKTAGLGRESIDLKLGTNRIGRNPENDFQLAHPTVSSLHCEMILADGAITLRDLESTNGTFVDGCQVRETQLSAGQTVRLGDVELVVESAEVKVSIPKFVNPELPAPPVVTQSGGVICPRHAHSAVTHQCTVCKELMCDACVHRIRRKGSQRTLLLCPLCSNAVLLIGAASKPKKRSLFTRVSETVKLKLTRALRLPGGGA